MSIDINAILTKYNGYTFRSRQEARWAVFFDYLGVEYEYEKEGFDLPCGYYLPDFGFLNGKRGSRLKGRSQPRRNLRSWFIYLFLWEDIASFLFLLISRVFLLGLLILFARASLLNA